MARCVRSAIVAAVFLALGACLRLPAANAGRLAGPYTDASYMTRIPFGAHSHYLQPWRSYMETAPASRFIEAVGINLTLNQGENPDIVLRMLAKNGIRVGRIEIGWSAIDWEDESKINGAERYVPLLRACKKYGIRPLILLNAHHGVPCPLKFFERTVTADAPAGSRQVQLDTTEGLVLGRSGFCNLTDYRAAEVLVTEIEGNVVKLSKPLPKAFTAGQRVLMATLKYRPFSVPGSDEWKETIAGWQRYVGTVARFVADVLGTRDAPDKGFDMEIWNEMSFGSCFIYINLYYDPPYAEYNQDSNWGHIVAATAEYAEAHPEDFAGVRFNDGFGNTLPWQASSSEPARISAIGKHPYARRRNLPDDRVRGVHINALGREDNYCPRYSAMFPEYFGTAIQTETMIRDMAPFDTEIYGTKHGRFARAGNPCTVWITEVGYDPREDGVTNRDEALALKAKAVARYLAFYINKGVDKLAFFAATGGDMSLGLVLDSFLEYSRTHNEYPADDEPYTSPALRVMRRMTEKMKVGLDPNLSDAQTRKLEVLDIEDEHDHFQFEGDGTPEHPPLYNREVFAFLPFQANSRRFVIAYYVMTRDIRKTLPPEEYTVTVAGLRGVGARFGVYDPIRDTPVPVRVLEATNDRVRLRLIAADYP
ncbi:MAG: hypothetical protein H5T86_12610, partial [Armatimonadetes bacterium]|nr:hypothetical protein [Armatimonadota bacterium]